VSFNTQKASTMTSIEYSKYNAFASGSLKGNPAAVVVLPKPDSSSQANGSGGDGPDANFPYGIFPSNSTLQTIATTINFPMTAFVVPFDAAAEGTDSPGYALRWFNPHHEAPLCGHATVAMSNHLFNTIPGPPQTLKLLTRLHGVVSATLQDNPLGEGKLVGIEFPEKYNLPSVTKGSQRWDVMQEMFEQASSSKWTDKGEPLGVYEDEQYVLVEFSPELDLKGLQLDAKVLTKLSKFVYMFQISTDSSEHIHTRVLNTFDGNHHEDIAVSKSR
jgi:PhzF family phenazine biosynthesis protein